MVEFLEVKETISISLQNTQMSASSSFQNAGSAGPAGFQAGNGEDPNSGNDVKPVSIFSNDYKK